MLQLLYQTVFQPSHQHQKTDEGGVLLFNNLVVDVGFAAQPSWEEIYRYRHFLTLNILNAFALNVAIAVFLKYLSPVSYILTGDLGVVNELA